MQLYEMSAYALAGMIKNKSVSCLEVTQAFIKRIEETKMCIRDRLKEYGYLKKELIKIKSEVNII